MKSGFRYALTNVHVQRNDRKYKNVMGKTVYINPATISCVYTGKPDKCMCGCSGKYAYTSLNANYSSKNRGYAVDAEDINDKRVERVINKMSKSPALCSNIKNYIFTKVIGQTQYTVYLIK